MDPFIQFLLGQGGGGVPPAQAVPEENVIEVQDRPFRSTMREGLVRGGPFAMGKTGGNILGILGDALLVGGGRDPMYQPRLRQAREAEAMIDYTDDPERAINQLSQIDPHKASELWNKLQERKSVDSVRQAQVRSAEDEYIDVTNQRALAYLGAATPRTYSALKSRIDQYYADRGVEPMFQLPDEYDEETIRSIARGGVPVTEQAKLSEQQRYHDAVLSQNDREEYGRNYREVFGEIMATDRNREDQAGADRRNREDNETRRETSGGRSRPNVRFGKRADGTRYVIR